MTHAPNTVTDSYGQAHQPTAKLEHEAYDGAAYAANVQALREQPAGGALVTAPQDVPVEVQDLAAEVLQATRNSLMVSFRFLDRALWKMPLVSSPHIEGVGTDGVDLSYHPERVIRRYAQGTEEAVRDYLHLILHCVFYHVFVGNDVNLLAWNLASDIVVEEACIDLAGERYPSAQDAQRLKVIEALHGQLGNLSAEKLYRHIMAQGISPEEADALARLFYRDDHAPWYKDRPLEEADDEDATRAETNPDAPLEEVPEESQLDDATNAGERELEDTGSGAEGEGEDEEAGGEHDEADEGDERDGAASDGRDGADGDGQDALENDEGDEQDGPGDEVPSLGDQDGPNGEGREQWEAIAKQLKADLELRTQQFGTEAGNLMKQLAVTNRHRYDYRSFLRRFAALGEELTVNDDEFDLVFYTYGLRLYGNLPLVEPLEYREVTKVREFVIAIDTSESCDGALVKRFVEETYGILKASESFFSKVNLHIMQCDAHVQSDVKITSEEEFERYLKHFTVHGLGGTDFRPVFTRVDALVQAGEFENLKGLIYFTDGYGTFPKRPTEYETVFVFLDDGFGSPTVPPWAFKLVLDEGDIKAGR